MSDAGLELILSTERSKGTHSDTDVAMFSVFLSPASEERTVIWKLFLQHHDGVDRSQRRTIKTTTKLLHLQISQ